MTRFMPADLGTIGLEILCNRYYRVAGLYGPRGEFYHFHYFKPTYMGHTKICEAFNEHVKARDRISFTLRKLRYMEEYY